MATSWKTVKVFISSTFRDMQAERDHLVRFVFPKLREELLARRIHLVDVDLRWGVTGEQDALSVCREIIDECHPRFLCMLGGRYGWIPPRKKHSITADEIHYGVLNRLGKHGYAFFYFRDPDATDSIIEENIGEYREPFGSKNEMLLDELKESIINAGFSPFIYPAMWDTDSKRLIELKEFGDRVYKELKQSIIDEFGEEPFKQSDEFQEEREAMDAFIEDRTQRFILGSRKPVLDKLVAHAKSSGRNGYMCLVGDPGSGKSAMLARLSHQLNNSSDPSRLLISHFVGASIDSTDIRLTLRRFCHDIYVQCNLEEEKQEKLYSVTGNDEESRKKRQEIETEYEISEDPEKLRHQLPRFLSEGARKKHIVILIDAINQLDTSRKMDGLTWLPDNLPSNVRIILSTIPGPLFNSFHNRHQLLERVELKPLDTADSREIIEQFLERYQKKLTEDQKLVLLAKKDASTPLYLLTALEELRTLSVSEEVADSRNQDKAVKHIIEVLPETSTALFAWIIKRLENDDGFRDESGKKIGPELVRQFSSLMGVSRHGLSQRELSELLASGDPKSAPIMLNDEQGNVAALIQLLRPYLMLRGELLDFYHGQFKESVEKTYLKNKIQRQKSNKQLTDYFKDKADPDQNQTWKGKTPRPFLQLAFHMAEANLDDELCKTLCDLKFIEAKCFHGQVFELQDDYRLCLEILPEAQEELKREREREARAAQWTKEIIEYSQKWSDRRDRKARGENIDEPEPQLPEIIPSVEPWSEERIQSECDRIIKNPNRFDQLQSFFNFVQSEFYPLLKFGNRPGFVIQHSYNLLPGNPVRNGAELRLKSAGMPMMLRHLPKLARYNPKPTILKTLEGHAWVIFDVAMTPDVRIAVSASYDKTLRVWDLKTSACLKILEGHSERILSVSITPDARIAVSASYDETLRVWDLETGACLKTLLGHIGSVECVRVTPDSKLAVSASTDKTIRLWDIKTGTCLKILKGHSGFVNNISVTPDSKLAISASTDETLRVWDLETGACLKILEGHSGSIQCVSVTPDSKIAVSASSDKILRVWDLETGACLKTMKGHTGPIESVSVTPDAKQAVSGGTDETIRVWDLESGDCLKTLEGHCGNVKSVSVTPDARRAVSASADRNLFLWDLETGVCSKNIEGHTGTIASMSVTRDSKLAVSASTDKTLRVWDIKTGTCLKILEGHIGSIRGVSVSPNDRCAVSGGTDNTLRVWDIKTGTCLKTLEGHSGFVNNISVTPDSKLAVSGSTDETLRVWDLETGACLKTLKGHSGIIESVTVTPDSRLAVSASRDKTLRVWDLETGTCLNILEGHSGIVRSVGVTPDAKRAVSASHDRTLRVWDLETGTCLNAMEGHSELVHSVSVTPDAKHAVSGSLDRTLRLWNLKTGTCLKTLKGHTGWINSVIVTPDARYTLSACNDKTIRVWDLTTGQCIVLVRGDSVWNTVGFSGLLNQVIGGASSGEISFYNLLGIISGPAICTASKGLENSSLYFRCPWCKKDSSIPVPITNLIESNMDSIKLEQSPDGFLRSYVLSAPQLLMSCSHCNRPIRLNPFYISKTDYEATLLQRLEHIRTQPEIDLESLIGHLTALVGRFEKAGKIEETKTALFERDETIRKLAKQKAKVKSMNAFRLQAFKLYSEGQYSKSENLLRRVLEAGFEISGTRCELALVLIMMDKDDDAKHEISLAWENRSNAKPYIIPRILFLKLTFLLLETGGDLQATGQITTLLGKIQTALKYDNAYKPWRIKPVLDHIKDRLSFDSYELLRNISSSVSSVNLYNRNMENLENMPLWREAKHELLD